jgi:hypothetical protein
MTKLARSALGEALTERVLSLARTNERLRALEDESEGHVVGEPDAETVLRSALLALCSREGYDSARRILAGEQVSAGDRLQKAGLVVWDPAANSMRPTALLIELIGLFEAAIAEAQVQP